MYLFFNVNGYFFALNTTLVQKVYSYEEGLKEGTIVVDGREQEVFNGSEFLKITKGKEGQKKKLLFLNSKRGYNFGLTLDSVEGFFELEKIKVVNKVGLLNKYGYQYIDFAGILDGRIIFVFFDEFFDERYKELTCPK
ncbi:MAG: hypothetical protein N2999_02985 [Proteobacteria bacterium]|nr:hypothetical protein [Pseudomonadota bacterium]